MANRLPKGAAIIAALIAVPLGAGAATAAPASKPAPRTVESVSQAKALAKLVHERSTHRSAAKAAPKPNAAGEPTTGRLAGADRYATSVAVSKASYDDKQLLGGTVVVASGTQFPDALAGGPAAAGIGGPMLLVPPTGTVPAGTMAEIQRLGVDSIVIMGGTGAVSAGVEDQLAKLVSSVDRLYGDNRYETAAFASYFTWQFDEANPDAEPTPPSVVYISSGATYADALAGGAAGAIAGAPLMLTNPASLPDVTKFALEDTNPTEVRILGGTGAVSGTVATQIRATLPKVKITRFAGANRFATAALTAQNLGLPTGGAVTLANGFSFPDALSASTSSAVIGAPVLLVRQQCVPAETFGAVDSLQPSLIRAVGGAAIVSNDTLAGKPC